MPIFEYNGNKVNVNDDQISEFAKYHPDAITKIERDGKVYGVRPGDMEAFNARFTDNHEGEQASQVYYQPQATESTDNKDTGSYVGDLVQRFGAGAAGLVGSAAGLLDKATFFNGGVYKKVQDYANSVADDLRGKSDRYQGKGFTDLVKEGDYVGALGSGLLSATESLPMSLGIMATGGAGLVGAGAMTASDKYDQLKKENPEMPEFKKWSNSIATGAAESLSEVFGMGTIGRAVRSTLKTAGKQAAADLVKKGFLDRLASAETKHWITAPILAEGSEEAANALAEYAIDKLTGVERNDNILQTVIDAAVPGAMGGAQFVPFTGLARRRLTNEYKEASKGVEGILNEQEKAQFDETIHRFQQNGDVKNIDAFLNNVFSAKNMGEDQKRAMVDYTKASMSYNNYVSYVNNRINEEAKKRMDDIDSNLNKDMDAVVEAYINGDTDNPVFITRGNLVEGEPDDDMKPTIDYDKSDDVIYYRDSDGKIQQCDVKNVTSIVNTSPRADLYAQIMEEVRGQIINEEESDVNFAPGDNVVLPDGRKGNIQSRMEDGRFTVTLEDGTTVALPYDQLVKPEEAAAQAEQQQQQSEEERIANRVYPTDKKNRIDYGQINDPQMYHDALIKEFGEDGIVAAESKMNNSKKDLEAADKKQDPIERLRAKREAKQKVDFFTQVYNMFPRAQETEQTTDVDNTAEQPVENVTDQAAETKDLQPVANNENPVQEAVATPYEDRPVEDTVYDLLDGQMDIDEVNQFVEVSKKEADKALKEIEAKKPAMTTNRDEYLRQKSAWQALMDEAKRKSGYWDSVKANLQEGSMTDAERNQLSVLKQNTPVNAEELAARAIADGSIKLLRDDFKKETGGGNTEANKMFGIFASEAKGGVSIERAGEILTQMDQEAGTNFIDPNDSNAARDVIIDVLSQARTRGDLINYIRNQRDAQLRKEEEAAYNDFAKYTTEAYGMTPEEYKAYEEDFNRNAALFNEEVKSEISGVIYDSIKQETDDYNEVEQQLNNNDYGENEQGGVSEEGFGGGEILSGQPSVPVETGNRGTEGERIIGNDGYNENGAAPEEGQTKWSEQERSFDYQGEGKYNEQEDGRIDSNGEDSSSNRVLYEPLADDDVSSIIESMKKNVSGIPQIELNPRNWIEQFGEDSMVDTPVGKVKIGENQISKLFNKERSSQFGMIKPTLEDPQLIIEEQSESSDGNTLRNSSYIFIKTFINDSGDKFVHFENVTVSKEGKEVSISSHIIRENQLKKKLKNGRLLYKATALDESANSSAEQPVNVVGSQSSSGKDNITFVDKQEKQGELFENDVTQAENEDELILPAVDSNTIADVTEVVSGQDKGETAYRGGNSSNTPSNSKNNITPANKQAKSENKPKLRYSLSVDKETGITTLTREDMSGAIPVVDASFNVTAKSPEEMLGILSNPQNGMKDILDEVGVSLENQIKTRNLDRSIKQSKEQDSPQGLNDWKGVTDDLLVSEEKNGIVRAYPKHDSLRIELIKNTNNGTQEIRVHTKDNQAETPAKVNAVLEKEGYYVDKDGSSSGFVSFDNYEDAKRFAAHVDEVEKQVHASVNKEAENTGETSARIAEAGSVVNTNPTDAQKEAGNYKMGHVKVAGFDVTIENPAGSVRSGIDSDGERWENVMNNTYGYFRGTKGVDGDHIDVYLSNDIDGWDGQSVYVIDQYNPDGSFDEHKVMFGFNDKESARRDFLANYDSGWGDSRRLDAIPVSMEDFKKWIDSSHRKTKPFAEYASVKAKGNVSDSGSSYGSKNKIVSNDRYEELKRRMREKLGQLNMGIDPEMLQIGIEMAVYHIEAGATKFADFSKAMIGDLGDKIRPYLKAFYNGARDLPETTESGLDKSMTPYDEVRSFDVVNFAKPNNSITDVIEGVANERNVEDQVKAIAKKKSSKPAQKQDKKGSSQRKKEVTSRSSNEVGLFDNINEKKEVGNGLQRIHELRPEGLPTDGVQPEQGLRGVESATGQGTGQESRGADGVGEGYSPDANRDRSEARLLRNQRNNRLERGVDYAPRSVDSRIEANIKAIELANELYESGEQATPDQMAVLRRFSGWGGLGKAFQKDNPTSNRLRELLGDEAYEQANNSRNSAYYTPSYIIDSLWDVARNLGFKDGRVLEGSAGIGNIIGAMPKDMSDHSDIQAVEIDQTTGKILSLLYPDVNVEIQGFESTKIENGSVDLAITNVPFVTGLRVIDETGDKDLSKKFRNIHDFCIAKNVRKLREGGIGIFISSNGTLDNSQKLLNWVVNEGKSDFIGAFRMNNKTFGGTGATSDIIVIRKRVNGVKSANAIDVSQSDVERVEEYDTGETRKVKGKDEQVVKSLAMDYNKYFMEHPENMAGTMRFGFEEKDTYHPTSKGLYPSKNKDQELMLEEWVKSFAGKSETMGSKQADDPIANSYESLGKDVKEGSMVINKAGKLCVASFGNAVPLELNDNKVKGHTKKECFLAYREVKRALSKLMDYQANNDGDEGLQPLLDKLNSAFDSFVKTYGHLHKNTAISFLKNDIDFQGVLAIEEYKEKSDSNGKRYSSFEKTDVFRKRVIDHYKDPVFSNVKDGIIASIYKNGRIDVPYIASALGRNDDEIRKEIISGGLGFEDPVSREIEVGYEYLSGNVREKLAKAKEENKDGRYDPNIKALEDKIPMNIPSHLIEFSIGSSWIDSKLYDDFVKEMTGLDVKTINAGGTWDMEKPYYVGTEKNKAMGVRSEKFHRIVLGHELIEAAMQNKTITVSETSRNWDGTTETITDKEATQACSNKIDEIRQQFKDWARARMQNDPDMANKIESVYNERFNNYVPKSIPDEFIPKYFPGASKRYMMRPHQAKAIIRGTTQPLLLAHEVGTGKTFTMISIAMEMRRLGTAKKPMIVVQNATTGQFVESAKSLYPNAKVLSLGDKDHTLSGRQSFYAKIKYNDWDMIVIPQSVFERIPDSEERRMAFVKDKIDEKMAVLERMKDNDESSFIVKAAEREISRLSDEIASIGSEMEAKKKERDAKKDAVTKQNASVMAMEMLDREVDDVENFDDMGIDAILVDEAHEYKHLGFATAMQKGVKGVDPSYSKKAQGVYLKAQSVLEKNNGKNVIFATGTPISNTAAEIWTFMRYLMPADMMKEYDIYYFDDFVRNFGNLQQMLEFTTSGNFKENNRFAGYVNLPELVRIWSSVADTVRTEEAEGVKEKIPDMETGKAQDIYLPQTKALRGIMKYVKEELRKYDNMSGKEKKANSHIPLTMYGIAKAAAVDARLVSEDAADDPNSKTNESVRQTLRALKDSEKYKGTVALFADNYQNKKTGFNLYEDIKKKLVKAGVPSDKIVIMRSDMTAKKKLEIFDKVNSGDIRVIMGSTFTLGTGVNIQERLHTLIHIDAPNRPMDYTQRNGRILRQGNIHKDMGIPVRVLRFGVEDSLDVTAYQRLKTKGAIAESIMRGKEMMKNNMENRSLEEDEDVFGDTVAQLSGSEYAMLKNQAEKDVRKFSAKRKQWEADQTYIHNAIPSMKGKIKEAEERMRLNEDRLSKVKGNDGRIKANGATYNSVGDMAEFFKNHNKRLKEDETKIREKGTNETVTRELSMNIGGFDFKFTTTLSGEFKREKADLRFTVGRRAVYSCPELGIENRNIEGGYIKAGVESIVKDVISGRDFKEWADNAEASSKRLKEELSVLESRKGQPFQFVQELNEAVNRLEDYTERMKKELLDKEAKYAKMDSEVKAATGLSEAVEDDGILYREGEDVFSDDMSVEEIVSRAKEDGTYMKAPNGKPSKLTPHQWAQVRTKAFKDWFGDWINNPDASSKVVDENGEPMVVYHGTNNSFSVFERGHGTKGRGFFFTDNKDMAGSYGENVMEVFLNIRESYEIDGKGRNWDSLVFDVLKTNNDLIKRVKLLRNKYKQALEKGYPKESYDYVESTYFKYLDAYEAIKDSRSILDRIKKFFYLHKLKQFPMDTLIIGGTRDIERVLDKGDSMIFRNIKDWGSRSEASNRQAHDVFVVTSSEMIKSATDNVGTFDGNNPDIRYRKGDDLNDIKSVNQRFNEELDGLNEGNAQSVILNVGNPGEILRSAGISNMPIRLYGNKLLKKIRKHGFKVSDVKDLPMAINDPIAVFNNYGNERNRAVLTELKTSQGNILATIEWGKGTDAEINIVTSVFGKGKSNIIDWINKGFATYINKAKALDYLRISAPIAEAQDNQELDSATKVVKDFENPPLNGRNINERSYEDGALLRPVTDEETLDKLNSEKTIRVYRAMQVIDGKLYPPMSAKVEGKLREPININEWEEAEERPELADDKGQFKLNKGNGSSLKAAYNPYIHTSRSPLNDQFSSAQDRDNLVVVEVEIPESELTSGYKAEKAKDPVGELTWHSGPVSSKLKGEKARKVILTRWDKPIRIVPDAEVAKRIAKLLEGEDIVMPSNVVTPSLRSELEKLGVPFIETDNRGKPILNRDGEGSPSDPTYRQRMRDEAVNMGNSLGVEVRIVEDGSILPGKRGKAKGFFDRADKSVTVVIGNHKSIGDIQATILHEIVGHYGLRQMFGERFDDMMDTVYRTLDKETRRKIADVALRSYRGDVRVATEEYLASIAERGVERPGVWSRVKSAIKEFFRSMGIDLRMSDEDIAYMLWKSKNRLKGGDSVPTVIDKIAKDQEMKEGLLYRDGLGFGSLLHTPKADRTWVSELAHDFMEKIRNGNPFTHETYIRVREGYQDSMIRVRDFQREIEKETGHKVEDFEDFYTYITQSTSRAQQTVNRFKTEHMENIWKERASIAEKMGKIAGEAYRDIETYMMIKHGLERNAVMRKREIDKLKKGGQNPSQNDIDKINAKDFSGLTAISEEITGNPGMDEQACGKWAADFESKYDTNALWNAINKATKAIMDQMRDTGMISKETYDLVNGMYKYYVPLKEWDGKRATDLYDYVDSDQDIVSTPLKKAEGRKTRAGNILANIASDFESATMMGYKNMAKQRLLNLVRNSGTGMASVSEQWYTRGFDANGNEIWEPAAATGFTEDPAHNAQVIQDFNDNMRMLRQSGDAMLHKDVLRLGVPVKKWQERQHTVRVKEAGRDILIYFNGDPRVAQAINGQNNVKLDNAVLRGANNLRKWMMLNYTGKNINFIPRNFIRDFFYVPTMNFVKYGAGFEARYLRNFIPALRDIAKAEFRGKSIADYESFKRNGGMTGYVEVMGYDRYDKEIKRLIKKSEGTNWRVGDMLSGLGSWLERANSVIENGARFATYRAAKQSDMSELKAIEAAKEASVNFNRRGSGQMGAVYAQNFYFFFNASIQGTQNFASAAKNNPGRAIAAISMWATLGYMARIIGSMLSGDDDDSYDNLPDYIRQNNIIIPVPMTNKYIMFPLPVELRAVFGLGDMMGQASLGQYKGRDFAGDLALKLADLLPKSVEFPDRKRNDDETMVEAVIKNVSPDAIRPILDAYLFNENYFGKRVTGRNDYNKHVPEWQKVSYGTPKVLIGASRILNELTGGDYATKGWADKLITNPSATEYIFEQYLGGVGKVIAQVYKLVEIPFGGTFAIRNVPVVSGLMYSTENMIPRSYVNERYSNYVDEMEETASRMRKYKDGLMKGEDLNDRFSQFMQSDEFQRYNIVDKFKKQIDGIYDMAKQLDEGSEVRNNLNGMARQLKIQMINELDKLDKDEK